MPSGCIAFHGGHHQQFGLIQHSLGETVAVGKKNELPIMVFRFFRNKAHLIFQTGAAAAA
jgi:hypothetical protein